MSIHNRELKKYGKQNELQAFLYKTTRPIE